MFGEFAGRFPGCFAWFWELFRGFGGSRDVRVWLVVFVVRGLIGAWGSDILSLGS